MKNLSIQQLEDILKPFRGAIDARKPSRGWIRTIREVLGMTNVQLAKRLERKPQSVLDLQEREAAETIQLNTLREVAEAMGCELVYAIVPRKPIEALLRERAEAVGRRTLGRVGHSMALEGQELGVREQERALDREIDRLLSGNLRRLWD